MVCFRCAHGDLYGWRSEKLHAPASECWSMQAGGKGGLLLSSPGATGCCCDFAPGKGGSGCCNRGHSPPAPRKLRSAAMKLDLARLDAPSSLRSHAKAELGPSISDLIAEPHFELPAVKDRQGFLNSTLDVLKPMHGTTTLAFVYKHGIVVAVDSRATQGPYIASQHVKKVIEINPYLIGTMAGGAADCLFWERNLGRQCRLRELENGRRVSVAGASKLLANTLFSYRSSGLSIGTTIAGWDESGPRIFYVDSDGTRMEGQKFAVGSGSTYAWGVLDNEYKFDLTKDAACELGRRAIYHATYRDAASGGTASVYHIGPQGWVKMSGDDVMTLHDRYYPLDRAVQGTSAVSMES